MSPRFTILAIGLVTALPPVGAFVAHQVWRPEPTAQHGELLNAPDLRPELVRPEALPVGRWMLVTASRATCDAACEARLDLMGRLRIAMGEHAHRVERVWITVDGGQPSADVTARHPGLVALQGANVAAADTDRIRLVDPQGRVVLRFESAVEPRAIVRDLTRLLKFSSQG